MGTICILLGVAVFLGSFCLGFVGANAFLNSALAMTFGVASNNPGIYIAVVGVCAFIGLLVCLNFVMLGLIYKKAGKRHQRR